MNSKTEKNAFKIKVSLSNWRLRVDTLVVDTKILESQMPISLNNLWQY